MAKGLRSKKKRANRALIRKELVEPLVAKAQQEMSKRLATDLKTQGASASALQKLKSALAGKKKAKSNDTVEYQKLAMDSEDTRGKADDKPVQQALVTLRKSSFSFRDVLGDGGKGAKSSR